MLQRYGPTGYHLPATAAGTGSILPKGRMIGQTESVEGPTELTGGFS